VISIKSLLFVNSLLRRTFNLTANDKGLFPCSGCCFISCTPPLKFFLLVFRTHLRSSSPTFFSGYFIFRARPLPPLLYPPPPASVVRPHAVCPPGLSIILGRKEKIFPRDCGNSILSWMDLVLLLLAFFTNFRFCLEILCPPFFRGKLLTFFDKHRRLFLLCSVVHLFENIIRIFQFQLKPRSGSLSDRFIERKLCLWSMGGVVCLLFHLLCMPWEPSPTELTIPTFVMPS